MIKLIATVQKARIELKNGVSFTVCFAPGTELEEGLARLYQWLDKDWYTAEVAAEVRLPIPVYYVPITLEVTT